MNLEPHDDLRKRRSVGKTAPWAPKKMPPAMIDRLERMAEYHDRKRKTRAKDTGGVK